MPGAKIKNGIRFYRQKLKESGVKDSDQSAVAAFVGRPRTLISQWETGEAVPSPEALEKLAEYLETTPGHIYTAKQIEAIYVLYSGQAQE